MSAARVAEADAAMAWAGADLALIRDRWNDHGPRSEVLSLTGETRIPRHLEQDTLEQLRRARADVQHLLAILDRIGV